MLELADVVFSTRPIAELESGGFDLVTCAMVLNAIRRPQALIRDVRRVAAVPGAQVWAVLHPSFYYSREVRAARQQVLERRTVAAHAVPPSYFDHRAYAKQVGEATIRHYHRPASWYVNALLHAGFSIQAVHEPRPSQGERPPLVDDVLPKMLVIVTSTTAS